MTAALEGGEWSAAHPGRTLPPGKTWYPFYRRLGGPQGRSGRAENLAPTGIRSRTRGPQLHTYFFLLWKNLPENTSFLSNFSEQWSIKHTRTNQFHEAESSRIWQFLTYSKNSMRSTQTESSLPQSQAPVTCSCPETNHYSPRSLLFLQVPFPPWTSTYA